MALRIQAICRYGRTAAVKKVARMHEDDIALGPKLQNLSVSWTCNWIALKYNFHGPESALQTVGDVKPITHSAARYQWLM